MIHKMRLDIRIWRISRDAVLWHSASLILLLALFFLCPWGWKAVSDHYFPYSGVVVERGCDLLWYGRYIVIEDATGKRSKKYVDPYGYAYVRVGMAIIKERGFGKHPLPAGQKPPFQMLQEIKESKKLRESQGH
jgi:hypothetical protein